MAGDRGHDELPTQTLHHFLFGKSFKFTVDVFHSPQMGFNDPCKKNMVLERFFLGGNPIPRRSYTNFILRSCKGYTKTRCT